MQGLAGRWYWCPRCGTVREVVALHAATPFYQTPSLVGRCQQFEDTLGPRWGELWVSLGIQESLWPPNARKPLDGTTAPAGQPDQTPNVPG
jgi:hypothetical protein